MSARRPLVGITTYAEQDVRWGVWNEPAALIPLAYVRAVEAAAARPLLVPPVGEGVDETLDILDALVFSGGNDLDPGTYGAEAHPETKDVVRDRDRAEQALLEAALLRDMPVLAVCRGSQVLNVARGGDLVQHLPEVVGHDEHRETPGEFSDHEVSIAASSRLGSLLGERAEVKSHHHQGYGRLGDELEAVAWAEDGSIEALEDPAKRFALGVLWHPEEGGDLTLFHALVEEARAYRAGREHSSAGV
jgi:putative glutamine amidotransferase